MLYRLPAALSQGGTGKTGKGSGESTGITKQAGSSFYRKDYGRAGEPLSSLCRCGAFRGREDCGAVSGGNAEAIKGRRPFLFS